MATNADQLAALKAQVDATSAAVGAASQQVGQLPAVVTQLQAIRANVVAQNTAELAAIDAAISLTAFIPGLQLSLAQCSQSIAKAIAADSAPTQPYTLTTSRPRFWSDMTDVKAKAATPEGVALVKGATTIANGGLSFDRLLSRSLLYRLSGDAMMGANAAADLVSLIGTNPPDSVSASICPAVGYDAVWTLLSASNLATVQAALRKRLLTRDNSTIGLWCWTGYNNRPGDAMPIAIATNGDLDADYVADVWQNNWNAPGGIVSGSNFWSYNAVIKQMGDCGNNEGFGYFTSSNGALSNFCTRGLWKTATGNTYLEIGYFDRYPLWFLWQMEPGFPKPSGIGAGFPWAISDGNYEGGSWVSSRDAYDMLRICTSGPNGALARWCLDQNFGFTNAVSRPGLSLLAGCFLGDPRVKGVSPMDLAA